MLGSHAKRNFNTGLLQSSRFSNLHLPSIIEKNPRTIIDNYKCTSTIIFLVVNEARGPYVNPTRKNKITIMQCVTYLKCGSLLQWDTNVLTHFIYKQSLYVFSCITASPAYIHKTVSRDIMYYAAHYLYSYLQKPSAQDLKLRQASVFENHCYRQVNESSSPSILVIASWPTHVQTNRWYTQILEKCVHKCKNSTGTNCSDG